VQFPVSSVEAADRQVQELTVPGHPGDRSPGQRGQRRVEGLQHGKRRRVGTGNGVPDGTRPQEKR
jgi:hypothetical protein